MRGGELFLTVQFQQSLLGAWVQFDRQMIFALSASQKVFVHFEKIILIESTLLIVNIFLCAYRFNSATAETATARASRAKS